MFLKNTGEFGNPLEMKIHHNQNNLQVMSETDNQLFTKEKAIDKEYMAFIRRRVATTCSKNWSWELISDWDKLTSGEKNTKMKLAM